MKVKSPKNFIELKKKNALFAIRGVCNYSKSRSLSQIESEWDDKWRLFFIDSYQNLSTWKQVEDKYEEIVNKDELQVWTLYKDAFYWNIPLIFWWKTLEVTQMEKLLEKMRLVWEQIDYLHQDFITGKSIKFDMGKDGKILSNIYDFYHRSFLSRVSTGLYKITEMPIKEDNTSLTDILCRIQKLDILDQENTRKLEWDIHSCSTIQTKVWNHSRNILVSHMDFKAHKELSVVDENKRTISTRWTTLEKSWWVYIKKLHEIHKYWLWYIFVIIYSANISQAHCPQELEEYEYNLFLTVIDKETWELKNFDDYS